MTKKAAPKKRKTPAAVKQAAVTRMARAETMADDLIDQGSGYGNRVGMGLMRFLARIREELEDIWAEANSLRLNQKVNGV